MAMKGGYQVLDLARPDTFIAEVIRGSGGKRIVISGATLDGKTLPDITTAFAEQENGKYAGTFLYDGKVFSIDETANITPVGPAGGQKFKYYNYAYNGLETTQTISQDKKETKCSFKTNPASLEISKDGKPVIIAGCFLIRDMSFDMQIVGEEFTTVAHVLDDAIIPIIIYNQTQMEATIYEMISTIGESTKERIDVGTRVHVSFNQTQNTLSVDVDAIILSGNAIFFSGLNSPTLDISLYTTEVDHDA